MSVEVKVTCDRCGRSQVVPDDVGPYWPALVMVGWGSGGVRESGDLEHLCPICLEAEEES